MLIDGCGDPGMGQLEQGCAPGTGKNEGFAAHGPEGGIRAV